MYHIAVNSRPTDFLKKCQNLRMIIFLVILPFCAAFCPKISDPPINESVPAALIEEPLNSEGDYVISKIISPEEGRPFQDVTACMWIRPLYFRGLIFRLKSITADDDVELPVFSIKQSYESVILEEFTPIHRPDSAVIREWTHICVLYGKNISMVLTAPGTDQQEYGFTGPLIDLRSASQLKASIGADIVAEELMIGFYADVRIYLSLLSMNEIKDVSLFRGVEKPYYSVLETFKNGTSTSISAGIQRIDIAKSTITKPYNSFMIWYFQEKVTCKNAITLCKRLNGRMLSYTPSLLTQNLLQEYSECINKIDPFWVSAINEGECAKGVYRNGEFSSSSRDLPILSTICVTSKEQLYYFKSDDERYTFKAIPTFSKHVYRFENYTENLKLTYNSKEDIMKLYRYNHLRKTVQIKCPSKMLGRYKWETFPEKNKDKIISFSACNETEFTCTNGECVSMEDVCNFNHDCQDYSDENYCQVGIKPNVFYEKRWSPAPSKGNLYTTVSVHLHLNRVVKVNMNENTVALNLQVKVSWKDTRLKFKHLTEQGIPREIAQSLAKHYWSPRITLPTAVSESTKVFHFQTNPGSVYATLLNNGSRSVQIYGGYEACVHNGDDVLITAEKTEDVKFLCKLNLFSFPFDNQRCEIPLVLENTEAQAFLVVWDNAHKGVTVSDQATSNLYTNLSFYLSDPDSNQSSKMSVTFSMRRKNDGYIFIIFLPCIIMVIIGILTFFMPYSDYSDRATVTVSSLIVVAALFTQVSSSLPSTSEPKLIDIWMFCHVFLLFLVFIFTVLVMFLHHKSFAQRNERSMRLQRSAIMRYNNLLRSLKFQRRSAITDEENSNIVPRKYSFLEGLENFQCKKFHVAANRLALCLCSSIYIVFLIVFFSCAVILD